MTSSINVKGSFIARFCPVFGRSFSAVRGERPASAVPDAQLCGVRRPGSWHRCCVMQRLQAGRFDEFFTR
jgi:hypothetical protein